MVVLAFRVRLLLISPLFVLFVVTAGMASQPSHGAPASPAFPPIPEWATYAPASLPGSAPASAPDLSLNLSGFTQAAVSLTLQGDLGGCNSPGWGPIQQSSTPNGPWTNVTEDLIGHPIEVAPLLPTTTYYFRMAFPASLNCGAGVTPAIVVTTPPEPVMSVANVTTTSASLTWTDPAQFGGAITFLGYYLTELQGPSPGPLANSTNMGGQPAYSPVRFTSLHSAQLNALTPATTYSLRITSSIGNDGSPPWQVASANSSVVLFTTSNNAPFLGVPPSVNGVSTLWIVAGVSAGVVLAVGLVFWYRRRH